MSSTHPFAVQLAGALAGKPFSYSQLYLAAFTSIPGDDGDPVTHEVVGSGYQRVPVTLTPPSSASSTTASGGQVSFPVAQGSWGQVAHLGLCPTPTGGTVIIHDPLSGTPTIGVNQILRVNVSVRFK
jgi:hypothetical protein